ncbi:MAG TPA: Gfo/Idh/MocA family oxidoreductase [Bryobacteraceae bacterium]|nr:Gfo/Idh/MocA family oxidoreductase [Bryobacteraceae bacterium]
MAAISAHVEEMASVDPHLCSHDGQGLTGRPSSPDGSKSGKLNAAFGGDTMNRRQFVQTGVIGLASAASRRFWLEAADQPPKRVGLIGCGWYGKSDLFRLVQVAPVEIVSLCDVDRSNMAECAEWAAARQISKKTPRQFTDYREMLKQKDLDLVEIATPDHWHALPMIEAAKAGVDIYVQKPISVDVMEGQAMLAAARKYNRVVQVGMQRRSTPHLIEARDIVKEGKLGTIGLVEIYSYGGGRPSNPQPEPVPETLDWDFWVGPAPMMTYSPEIQRNWRQYMEYGNGTIGDMGIHMLDMVRWFMDLRWPKRISSFGGLRVLKGGKNDIADAQTAMFEYDGLTIVWQHRRFGPAVDPKYPWGATLYGEQGTLKAGVMGYDFLQAAKGAQPIHKDVTYELEQYPEDKTEPRLEQHVAPAIRGHMKDLLAKIATRGRPVSDIEEGYISSSCCILANLSMRLGRTLAWDEQKGTVAGDEEANRLLHRPYRKPWQHPELANV